MLNFKLKHFLKYLRSNRVIEDYQLLFDRLFDYSTLLELDDESIGKIYEAGDGAPIVLYEQIKHIQIPDNIYSYISSLKSKELQKYAVRMAVGKYNSEDSLRYIMSVCEGKSISSSRYAYSIAVNDKLDKVDNKLEYIDLVANSDEDTSIQMRDLILENGFLEKEDNLALLRAISPEKEYVARYMIKLYSESKSMNNVPIISFAIGETQARYTYELLRNKKVMEQDNSILLAILVAQSEVDDGYKVITLVRDNDCDNLYERSRKLLDREEQDIDIDELFKSGNLSKIISGLSHVSDSKDIKSKKKTYN